jgi:hypothetical protein
VSVDTEPEPAAGETAAPSTAASTEGAGADGASADNVRTGDTAGTPGPDASPGPAGTNSEPPSPSDTGLAPAEAILGSATEVGRLVDSMLADDQNLAQSLDDAGLTREELIGIVQARSAQIAQSVTPESESVARAQVLADSASRLEITPRQGRAWRFLPTTTMVGGVVLLAGAAIGISYLVHLTSRERLLVEIIAGSLAVVFGVLGAVRQSAERVSEESAERARQRSERLDLTGVGPRLEAARKALDTALIAHGIRPAALARRDQLVTPEYGTNLQYVSARGLSEIYNAERFEVSTEGSARVKRCLESMPGGSVGLAGPRGTGKSTVIASFVAGRTTIGNRSRGLSVEVSAPVEYDPRDFLLHLFAETCRKVFVTEPVPGLYEAELANRVRRSASRNRTLLTLLLAGSLTIVGALLVLIGYQVVTFRPQLWVGFALISVGYIAALWAVISPNRARPYERQELRQREAGIPAPGFNPELVDQARQDLAQIRFQQTYTSGWSGSLTATAGPLAAQAGVTGQASYQQNVLSLPDIVTQFQRFIAKAGEDGPVVIGIDELDKIQNPDRAQAFLNDIKSVFGMEGCYFLISISEEALASFERRGLPIRDAFDSALDDVVRVGPLDYQTGRKLIRGRVVGLSEPYVALAYCLSGGLPRDMIRWARSIVLAGKQIQDDARQNAEEPGDESAAKEEHQPGLTEVTAAVVGEDLKRKVQASLIALSELMDSDAADSLKYLGELKVAAVASWLLARSKECLGPPQPAPPAPPSWLAALMPGLRADQPASNSATSPRRKVMFELAGYFYFCATVLEAFTDELSEAAFQQLAAADGPASFGQLAHARQLFGTDTLLAVARIDAFREACGQPCVLRPGHQPAMSAQFAAPRPTSTIQT